MTEMMFSTSDDSAARDERTISSSWRTKAAPSELPIIVTGKNAVRVWRARGSGYSCCQGTKQETEAKRDTRATGTICRLVRRDKDPRWGVGQETRLRGSSANPKGGTMQGNEQKQQPAGCICVCGGGGCNRDFFDRWRWMGERMGGGKAWLEAWEGDDKPFCCWMDEWRREEEGGGGERERATQVR